MRLKPGAAVVNRKASSKGIPLRFKYVFRHNVSQIKWDYEPNSSTTAISNLHVDAEIGLNSWKAMLTACFGKVYLCSFSSNCHDNINESPWFSE